MHEQEYTVHFLHFPKIYQVNLVNLWFHPHVYDFARTQLADAVAAMEAVQRKETEAAML